MALEDEALACAERAGAPSLSTAGKEVAGEGPGQNCGFPLSALRFGGRAARGLLDDVRNLVGEQLEPGVGVVPQRAGAEEHVGSRRERLGVNGRGKAVRRHVVVESHAAEVGVVSPLERLAQAVGDRRSPTDLGADGTIAPASGVWVP